MPSANVRSGDSSLRTTLLWGAVVFVVALIMRLVFLFQFSSTPLFDTHFMDMDYFYRLATEGIRDTGFPEGPFFKAPLYPLFLKIVFSMLGSGPWPVRIVQVLMGSASALLTFLLAMRLFSLRTAVIAGLFVALCGTLVLYDAQILVPTLAILLNLLALYCLIVAIRSGRSILFLAGGLFLGLSAIARPTVLLFALAALLYLVWGGRESAAGQRWRQSLLVLLGMVIAIAPVTIRNYLESGDFVLIGTYSGINLYIGNNLQSDGVSAVIPGTGLEWWEGASMDDSRRMAERDMGRPLSAVEQSDYWRNRAVKEIVGNPGFFVGHLWRKWNLLIGGYELANNFDIYYLAKRISLLKPLILKGPVFWPWGILLPAALAGMVLVTRWSAETKLLLLFLSASVPAFLLFFVTARYRLPMIPVLAVFAAYAIDAIISKLKGLSARRIVAAGMVLAAALTFCHLDPYRLAKGTEAQGHQMMAALYERNGNLTKAERYYRLALAEDYTLPHANNDLGLLLLSRGNIDEAIRHLQTAVDIRPDDWLLRYNLGVAYLQANRLEEAVILFQSAREFAYDFFGAANNLGIAWMRLGRCDSALVHYRDAVAIEPDDVDGYLALGYCHHVLGSVDSCHFYYARAARLAPQDPLPYYYLGHFWLGVQEYDSCGYYFRRFLGLSRQSPDHEAEVRRVLDSLGLW